MKEFAKGLYEELNIQTPKGQILQPSSGIYQSIFAWDSAWHYYWLKDLDPHRAMEELVTLFSFAEEDGRVPHEVPLEGDIHYPVLRRIQLHLLRHSFKPEGPSWYIDPPVFILAALDCIATSKEISPRGKEQKMQIDFLHSKAISALSWIRENRCPEFLEYPYSQLPVILHPLESGTDFAPTFDEVWGKAPLLMIRTVTLLKKIKSTNWSLKNTHNPRFPMVFDLTFLTFYLLSVKKNNSSATDTHELLDAFWDGFFDTSMNLFRQKYWKRGMLRKADKCTLSSILPSLVYHDTDHREKARSIIETHCIPGKTFWKGKIPSFNPAKVPKASSLLWRGSCSWMNMNYCLFKLLLIYDFKTEAGILFERLKEYIQEVGPSEYYDSFAFKGGGATPFSWNGLILAMETALQ